MAKAAPAPHSGCPPRAGGRTVCPGDSRRRHPDASGLGHSRAGPTETRRNTRACFAPPGEPGQGGAKTEVSMLRGVLVAAGLAAGAMLAFPQQAEMVRQA